MCVLLILAGLHYRAARALSNSRQRAERRRILDAWSALAHSNTVQKHRMQGAVEQRRLQRVLRAWRGGILVRRLSLFRAFACLKAHCQRVRRAGAARVRAQGRVLLQLHLAMAESLRGWVGHVAHVRAVQVCVRVRSLMMGPGRESS